MLQGLLHSRRRVKVRWPSCWQWRTLWWRKQGRQVSAPLLLLLTLRYSAADLVQLLVGARIPRQPSMQPAGSGSRGWRRDGLQLSCQRCWHPAAQRGKHLRMLEVGNRQVGQTPGVIGMAMLMLSWMLN